MKEIKALLTELKEQQQQKLVALGRTFIPTFTPDDLLQPNDFAELELNPHFRYEEGILHGIQSVEAAILYLEKTREG